MMKKTAMLLAAGALMALGSPALAFSPAPANLPVEQLSNVEHVAQGCGRGWARNAYGRCVPMAVRAPVVVVPRAVVRPAVVCRSVRTAYGWRRICR
jgi:hypothetical protein